MNRFTLATASLSLVAVSVLVTADEKTKLDISKIPPAALDPMDFQRDIQPIFAKACLSCHCADKQKGGLRLDDGAEAIKGSNSGPVYKPGDGAHSRLIHVVAGLDADTQMPPDKKKALTREDIGKLRAWIDQGAKWPKEAMATAKDVAKINHWAFQPPKVTPPPPAVAAWVQRNAIDNFIQARLQKEKVTPSLEADRVTLVRRLSLDLLGLPPTPNEVELVLNDKSADWYEKLVDRLLDSPHYGERWGRHWLDLARYADSDGYEKDGGRPFAWRFRHWVINALNRDLPFDQFTIEQLAGDLLPNATLEQKIATGFHRQTLTNTEGGVDKEQFRVEACVDRVNTTGKVWLGITLGCCQCHDHKYDPFSQREYYQFFAFFNSDGEVDVPAPLPGEEDIYNRKKAEFDKKKAELDAAVADYTKNELSPRQAQWEKDLRPFMRLAGPGSSAIESAEPLPRNDKQKQELAVRYAKTDAKLMALNKTVADHAKTAPQLTKAMTLALGSSRKTNVMIRGDFLRPGVEVQAGTPGIFPKPRSGEKPTRLDLAKWLVDRANPLTARVIMNWMWQKYFGRGIVATLEDFGTQGEKPSHSELLDWLASEFIRRHWSMKAMHKLIVCSATYRQSSAHRPELVSKDPINILLARQTRYRLEAELLRDTALASSGLLVRTVGGPSVRPPQPAGISELTYAGSARWVESTGADRYRRGLYTWFQRTSPYPMLMTFDAPDGIVCTARRERTNTPLQALTLLNDTVFVECAQALGKRIVDEKPADVKERLRHGFRLCVSREPSALEMVRLERLFNDLLQICRSKPDEAAKLVGKMKPTGAEPAEAAAWVALARTLMNLDEFVTRE
jgi:mono/diheme cytochrome c family protein